MEKQHECRNFKKKVKNLTAKEYLSLSTITSIYFDSSVDKIRDDNFIYC